MSTMTGPRFRYVDVEHYRDDHMTLDEIALRIGWDYPDPHLDKLAVERIIDAIGHGELATRHALKAYGIGHVEITPPRRP